ncbi:glycogen/starch/alpha-glucan phosphorylase [Tissierella creatinophila]|uniref:Alpha-1,4 glucan phosphorylase n=1 Tax=Tissierella creatinophila DSM 6911 TaxID=1123403 RepID=A0A1U7M6V8_TISCR|nr:glycogen/starch/alpha-glucan phosphorylase [Tissierella creatinophila]OLS02928.1 glycogen phosphorylase [Tissierella creatinophila DSM 6911]
MDIENIKKIMEIEALVHFAKNLNECNVHEKYFVLSKSLMAEVVPRWNKSNNKFKGERKAYYFSAEFLMGRALSNNIINLSFKSDILNLLDELGMNFNNIEEAEEDAALGNGGLGRLAACFLDSAATLDYPLYGYGIRYQYGLFKQAIEDGFQIETADNWLEHGDPWSIENRDEAVIVSYSDQNVLAIPFDTPIIGYGGNTINTLRLWKSESLVSLDFEKFNNYEYDASVKQKNDAENISKVLYPNDMDREGKKLRLRQQYFFVSASLQDLVRKYKKSHTTINDFSKFHSIQLNDTHPAVAIPELMRILTIQETIEWDKAWQIVTETFSYTNHTILAEALEEWPIELYKELLPNIYKIIEKINIKLKEQLIHKGISSKNIYQYEIISSHNNIRMAYLSIYGSHSVNGVARLHTEILKDTQLNNWYRIYPEKFNNKTNGITQRRWLLLSNPELSDLITELLGSDGWITDLKQIKVLEKYKDDEYVLNRFLDIKNTKKKQLAEYIKKHEGIEIDPNSLFDIQIKRFHEYKRQFLNALHILDLYFRIKENPNLDRVPQTFIFGGKAAPGYFRAKAIIKFINDIKNLIDEDPDVRDKLKVVFATNYRVTYGEKLFPAADLSEQISTAGKEASGTGNMKFMLNGALTIGTYDGANVEIVEEAGEENNFIFGLRVEDIKEIEDSYDPIYYYENVEGLKRVMDTLIDGTFNDAGTGFYRELYDSIIHGSHNSKPDAYFILKDFESYRDAQIKANTAYKDKLSWAKMCWMNLVNAGKFSSDRTVEDYANEIWHIKKHK